MVCGSVGALVAGLVSAHGKQLLRELVDTAPERIMWGTDWPHPNKYEVNPNDGDLVNAFGEWVQDQTMRQKIMTDNPSEFYRF